MSESNQGADFPSTIWTEVFLAGKSASPETEKAVAKLCKAYWYPIYAMIRRKGNDAESALDLTQAFFTKLLERKTFATADRARGRFRAFLRTNCDHFLIDERRRQHARVRGGGVSTMSIDARDAEGRYKFEPGDSMTPDRLFERSWALTLLQGVLQRLSEEYTASGRSETFEQLKVVLTEGRGAVRAAVLAERLGTTENAVHQATKRLRDRYREILHEEIIATLDDPSEVDEEIRSLFDAIRT